MANCIIFCAAGFYGLAEPTQKDDFLIAADGGLAHMEKAGLIPNGILGDFDSLGYIPESALVFPVEKDDTDAMLAVRKGLELDHTVANFQTLQFLADHGATGYLIGKDHIVTVVKNASISFPASASGILSVFCMGQDARGVTLQGLKYNVDDIVLTAGFPLGVSNHFTGNKAWITVTDGSLLVIYDRENGFPTETEGERK